MYRFMWGGNIRGILNMMVKKLTVKSGNPAF